MRRSLVSVFILMGLLFSGAFVVSRKAEAEPDVPAEYVTTAARADVPATEYVHDSDTVLRIYTGSEVEELPMHEYLCGVVRGEMLPSFCEAALCAQAVAERTYIYYQIAHGGKSSHPQTDVCTDPGCCNAYLSESVAREKWGSKFDEYNAVIEKAVSDTDGQVVLYEGSPILAVFHSSSSGTTASSGDVWTADLPYLVSVKSPENGNDIPNYYSVNSYSAEEFARLFKMTYQDADFCGTADTWIKNVVSVGERVDHMTIGGVTVSGKDLRSLYGLRSTAFTVDCQGDTITFHVTGYGHGVGLSQYGANELGLEGKTWQEILTWYYTDTTVGYYTGEE